MRQQSCLSKISEDTKKGPFWASFFIEFFYEYQNPLLILSINYALAFVCSKRVS